MAYSIAPNPANANEGAGTLSFTVTRSGSFPAETILASTTTNHGSSNSGDYAGLLNQPVSFATGQSSATVTVSITNDSVVEGRETFGFIVQRNASDPISTFLASSTFIIADNDVVPTSYSISPNPAGVKEGAGTLSFTVTRSGSFPAETVFASTTTNLGSSNSGDYAGLLNQAVSFATGETSKTVTVSITNDATVESNETFGFIVQRNASDPISTFLASSTFIIADNDVVPTSYSISPNPAGVNEGAGTLSFTVTRSGSFPAETVFASTTTNHGSSNSGDYAGLLNQAVSFAAGETAKTVTVSITNDATAENNETFGFIVQRNASDPISTFLASSSFTIADNDLVPTSYAILQGSASVDEFTGMISFIITRSGSLPAETVFASTTTNHGSINNGDYAGVLNQPVEFAAGQTVAALVTVYTAADSIFENDETFGFVVQRNPSDPIATYLANTTFTITDHTYDISPELLSVHEDVGALNFTITRSAGLPAETVFVSATNRLGSSNNNDYTALANQPVSFATNQTSASVTISITDDSIAESSETFGFIVNRFANNDPLSGEIVASSNFTIVDNDAVPTSYAIAPNPANVNEGAGTLSFTVTRSGSFPAETVFASTATNLGSSNSGDYAGLLNQAVSFATGETSKTVTVSITNDAVVESNETFGFIVQRNASDPISTFLASSTFIITNNSVVPTSYSISPNPANVNEEAGTLSFTLTRSNGESAQTIFLSTVQNQGSINNGDYLGQLNEAVTFAAGETSKTVSLQILDNTTAESTETFSVIVQQSPSDPISSYLAAVTFNITDHDTVSVNQRPLITGPSSLVFPTNSTINADELYAHFIDPDGSVTRIALWDSEPGTGGFFTLDDVKMAGSFIEVAPNELGRVKYATGPSAGQNSIAIQAIDNAGAASESLVVVVNTSDNGLSSNIYAPRNAAELTAVETDLISQIAHLAVTFEENVVDALPEFSTQYALDYGRVQKALSGLPAEYRPSILNENLQGAKIWERVGTLQNTTEALSNSLLIVDALVAGQTGWKKGGAADAAFSASREILIAAASGTAGQIVAGGVAGTVVVLGAGPITVLAVTVVTGVVVTVALERAADKFLWDDPMDVVNFLSDFGNQSPATNLRTQAAAMLMSASSADITPSWSYNADTGQVISLQTTNPSAWARSAAYVGIETGVQPSGVTLVGDATGAQENDLFTGTGAADSIAGMDGNDILAGLGGDDVIIGGSGNDWVDGGSGADRIIAGSGEGNDFYDGGADVDTIVYSSTRQGIVVNLSAASNQAAGAEVGTDQLAHIENVVGGSGNDQIIGNEQNNQIDGGAGADQMAGGEGNDTYVLRAGDGGSNRDPDVIRENVGEGFDTIQIIGVSVAGVRLETSPTRDFMRLELQNEDRSFTYADIYAPDGDVGQRIEQILFDDGKVWDLTKHNGAPVAVDDLARHAAFNTATTFQALDLLANDTDVNGDTLHLVSVSHPVNGIVSLGIDGNPIFTPATAYIGPASFSYTISDGELESTATVHLAIDAPPAHRPSNGDDVLIGGDGEDQINGGNGNDTVVGGAGDDALVGGNGNDLLFGGEGNDRLNGGNGVDVLTGGRGDDNLQAGNGDDGLAGDEGNDMLLGGNGDDTMNGGEGDDSLRGGNGTDILEGGAGVDSLTGGNGTDTFAFRTDFGTDIVNDFRAVGLTHDILQFDTSLFADEFDLFTHSADTADGVLITSDFGDTLLVNNVTIAQLQAHPEDLHFV
jgi:Ca2+-binding RTX toxin-like protein